MNHMVLLRDMIRYLDEVQTFTQNGWDAFSESTVTQYAVIYAYQVIGEIAKRFPHDFRDSHSEINWRKLSSFRDFLAHNYDKIIVGSLWVAVQDVSELKTALQTLHDSLSSHENL